MPPVSLRHAAVPSPALLRFLRAQSVLSKPGITTFAAPSSPYVSCARHNSSLAAPSGCQSPACPAPNASACQSSPAHTAISRPSAAPCRIFLSSAEPLSLLPRNKHAGSFADRRHFTNTPSSDFLWKRTKRKSGAGPLQPNDLPPRYPEGYTQDEHGNLGRVLRPINEPRIRCTEFDENGKITLVNSEFRKSELIAKVY